MMRFFWKLTLKRNDEKRERKREGRGRWEEEKKGERVLGALFAGIEWQRKKMTGRRWNREGREWRVDCK